MPPPNGPPPLIGVTTNPVYDGQTTAGDKVRLGVTDWRAVYEERPMQMEIKDVQGHTHFVTKMQTVTHWIGQGRWTDVALSKLELIDRTGQRLPTEAGSKLAGRMAPALFARPVEEFDAAHLKHFRPEVPIILAELPAVVGQDSPNMLPPQATFAKVSGDKLTIFKPIWERRFEKVPVKGFENGQEITKFADRITVVTKMVSVDHPVAEIRASNAAGEAVDSSGLAKQLAKESLVLAWENGWPVGDIYLAAAKPETLAIVLPPWSPPAEGAAPPMPVAPGIQPTGLSPRFARAQLFGDLLVLREPQPTTVQVKRQVSKTVDGRSISEMVTAEQVATHWHEYGVSSANFRLAGMDGQQLDASTAAKRLMAETMVLVSDQRGKVDPIWLSIYKPDTVVVYLRPPVQAGHIGVEPAPAAAPASPNTVP